MSLAAVFTLLTLAITPTALLCKSKRTESSALAVLNILTRDGEGGIPEVVRHRLFHIHNSNYSIFTNPANTIYLQSSAAIHFKRMHSWPIILIFPGLVRIRAPFPLKDVEKRWGKAMDNLGIQRLTYTQLDNWPMQQSII